jgi:serine/threonine protein kinase
MTSDRWRQIEELCHAALARPPADRAAFVADACAGDDVIRREVESLLAQEANADHFLSAPALVSAIDVLDPSKGALVGRRLGVYEIRSLLAVGGMGEVYRAHDCTLGREVAIKVLTLAYTADPAWRARLEREARILAALNHPHIGAIYGVEEVGEIRALVLELVEGETLAERIARNESGLPIGEVLAIVRQIIEALDAANQKGIVHRDLKPANIKIAPEDVVKVLDFGLAKAASPDGSRTDLLASHEGMILGTAAYMSPEQARGQGIDKRSDIWAFGCVLYEMLTGRLAFSGATISDTIVKVLEHEPDWTALPAATPPSIRRLLLRCLAKDPKQRLRDIGDASILIEALEAPLAPRPTTTIRSRLPWIAVIALTAAVSVWQTSRPPTIHENPLGNATFSHFTDWEGTEGGAEISPDGRFVAFVADRDGEFDLWVGQVGTGEFRNLTDKIPALGGPNERIRSFGFSGDGAEIWFSVAGDPVLSRKMLMPLAGGTPRAFLAEGEAAPSWSSDGSRLVYFKNTSSDDLFVADSIGGDARQIAVTAPEGEGWAAAGERTHNHNMVWSIDDQWLYFVHGRQQAYNWTDPMDVWRLRPAGGVPEQLTHQSTTITFLTPIDTRTLLYVARADDGPGPYLWALDVKTKIARRASSGVEQYTSVAASRDGRRIVATIARPTVNLWNIPILDRVVNDREVQPYQVPTVRALAPRFSAAALFYLSARGTADGLWRFHDGQTVELRKGTDGALFDPPAITRDGSRVAVVLSNQGKRRVAIMSADGTGFRRLAESIDIEGTPDWSPDGTWIVAGGSDAAHGAGLFKIPIDGSEPVRLVAGQAANPVWSPDGNLIVYAGPLVTGQIAPLVAVRPDGTSVDLPPVRVRPGCHRFLPDGTGIVYVPSNPSQDFWLLDLVSKQTRQLTRLAKKGRLGMFDVTPDGKHIVFDRLRENSDIVLIELPKQ